MYHLRIATSQPPAIYDSQPPPSCRLRVARMMFVCSLPFVLPVVVGAPGVLPAPPFGADANGGWFDREVLTTSFDASACVATVLKSFSYGRREIAAMCGICSAASAAEKRTDSMEQVHITPAANGNKPNIVMVLLDDWCAFRYLNLSSAALADCTAQCADLGLVWIGANRGWGNAGWNNPAVAHVTPTMNRLVAEGINISRHYVFKYCSPTRTAIQSGRAPYHVNVLNCPPTYYNPAEPTSGCVDSTQHEHATHH